MSLGIRPGWAAVAAWPGDQVSATDREQPGFSGVNGTLMARRKDVETRTSAATETDDGHPRRSPARLTRWQADPYRKALRARETEAARQHGSLESRPAGATNARICLCPCLTPVT
jgi:hypothetical protein